MLARLASACFRRRRWVLAAWLLGLVAALSLGPSLAGKWLTTDSLPGTDSQAAYDVLARSLPVDNAESDSVVFTNVPAHRVAVEQWLQSTAKVPGVEAVGPLQMARSGGIGRAPISLSVNDDTETAASALQRRADSLKRQGVEVAFSGDSFQSGSVPSSEIIGVVGALVVLVLAFGSMVAAGLPVLVALVGIGVAIPLVEISAHVVKMASLTTQVVAMIGIGVGIDYTLLVLTRYRAALDRGKDRHGAAVEAVDRAGRAVALAGATVMASSLGMTLIGMHTFTGLAVGIALGVAVSVLATLTLLPALLGLLGPRLERWRLGRRPVPAQVSGSSFAARWALAVTRRPGRWVLGALGVMVVLALPVTHLQLGQAGANTDPAGSTTRTAYDLTAKAFGPGVEGPILVVVEGAGTHPGAVARLETTLAQVPGVASIGPLTTGASGSVAVFDAVPTTGPGDRATVRLLDHLRHDVLPPLERATGVQVHLGGETASNIDFASLTSRRLPIFVGAVLAISFLLLAVVFRSVVVPLKAVVLNLLSVGAAYGVIVAVFQWGWGASLLGTAAAPIAPWIPVMVFAIVFGLSMDYEVFLVSAIRETWEVGRDPRAAVVAGLRSTSRLITAAAAIMVLVFGSFVTSNLGSLKVLGLGLAVAIALDATVIRMVLVPAVMTLLGRASWWLPRGLRGLERRPPPSPPAHRQGLFDAHR